MARIESSGAVAVLKRLFWTAVASAMAVPLAGTLDMAYWKAIVLAVYVNVASALTLIAREHLGAIPESPNAKTSPP